MLNSNVQLDLLRTFVAVAGARTFAEAAGRLHVSVSAVSQQIRTLEAQLGVHLFERVGRRARVTPEGRALHRALDVELARIDDAVAHAVSAYTTVRGPLAIGSPRTFGTYWLRPRLQKLLSAYGELELTIEFAPPRQLERRVAEGALDLALLVRPVEVRGLVTEVLTDEELVAVAAPDFVAKAGPMTTLAELAAQPYVVFDREYSLHATWWRAMFGRRAALPQRVVCAIASLEEMMALAEAGVAIAILPEYMVVDALAARRLRVVAKPRRPVRNTIYLVWRSGAAECARFQVVREALRAR